jgi:hypothetical protein
VEESSRVSGKAGMTTREESVAWLKAKGWTDCIFLYGPPGDWLEDPILHCGSHWEFALKEQRRRDEEPGYLERINSACSHLCTDD